MLGEGREEVPVRLDARDPSRRRELLLHCYRLLGSLTDAEDVLQETLLAAWRGLDGFEGRASVRSWLYRIATNRCLNALRDRGRRQGAAAAGAGLARPAPRRRPRQAARTGVGAGAPPGARGESCGCVRHVRTGSRRSSATSPTPPTLPTQPNGPPG
ncbi:sigma factor [Thermoactinospora rubra]|uniref:sigma factor n=1 Tax=Thermoactinospora rubra TaxID=1088767 RepID=UPI001980B834